MDSAPIASTPGLDLAAIRAEFPILAQQIHGRPLVYLDSANTTQKPQAVIDAESAYYATINANIHRSTHLLSERATQAYEGARRRVQRLIHARESREVVFTRGCTEAINLVAQSWGRANLRPGDEVVLTWMEHHSNIVPWQLVCEQTGARVRAVRITDRGELDLDDFRDALAGPSVKFVSLIHVSNALGTVNPVEELVRLAHERGVPILVDGAQAVPHLAVDVQALDCDFYAFSAHKLYGPTGIGALYGKAALLEQMPPWQGGGDMIASVTFERTTYNEVPYKFEAGTPNIAGVVGFGAAVEWLQRFDMAALARHERSLVEALTARLDAMDGIRIIGRAPHKAGVVSFVVEGVHPHDVGTILDSEGVAVRTGQHCAQPVMDRYGVPATVRASFGIYNTTDEVEALVAALGRVRELFG
ncbi:MAG: cysteine desulfurase [Vicinamibacteraceae bacterium]|nr:cysteine desulfurase [Vicinamibacteraceae bacterium]